MITEQRQRALMGVEACLNREILGQEEALRVLARALVRGELGLTGPGRPRSFMLFLGETGVGKTESVLAAGRELFGSEEAVIRLDMAEYAERTTALRRLLGAGPGDPGLLGRELAKVGAGGLLLLDEIEKAHPDVTRLFLGMEAARLTLADGTVVRLEGVHVICTSNLGSESARGLGGDVPYAFVKRVVEEEAREFFSSPVYARFTEVVVFRSLTYNLQRRICEHRLLRYLAHAQKLTGCQILSGPRVLEFLMRRGFHRDLGARSLRNAIEREVGNAIAGHFPSEKAACLQLKVDGDRLVAEAIRQLAD